MNGYQLKHRNPESICPFPRYDEQRTWAEFVDECCGDQGDPWYVELIEKFADTYFRGVWITYNLGDGPSWEFHLPRSAELMTEPDRDFWIAFRRAHDIPDLNDIEDDWDTWVCGRPFDVMTSLFVIVKSYEEEMELAAAIKELEAATKPALAEQRERRRL